MGLMDALSGRTSRRKRIEELAVSEPLARVASLQLSDLFKDYSTALAQSVYGLVRSLIDEKDSLIPEYASIGKNVSKNEAAIRRVSAYCAYWLQSRFIADKPKAFVGADSEDDGYSETMWRDLEDVESQMYPSSDAVVARAIALSKEIDLGQIESGQVPEAQNRLFSALLGIPRMDDVPFTEETVEYHEAAYRTFLAISAALIARKSSVEQILTQQASGNGAKRF